MRLCCRNNSAVAQTEKATENYASFFLEKSTSGGNTAENPSHSGSETISSLNDESEDAAIITDHSQPTVRKSSTDQSFQAAVNNTSEGGTDLKKSLSVTKGRSFADFFLSKSDSKTSSVGEQTVQSVFNDYQKTTTQYPTGVGLASVNEIVDVSSEDDVEEVIASISIPGENIEKSKSSSSSVSGGSSKIVRNIGSSLPSLRMRSLTERSLTAVSKDNETCIKEGIGSEHTGTVSQKV